MEFVVRWIPMKGKMLKQILGTPLYNNSVVPICQCSDYPTAPKLNGCIALRTKEDFETVFGIKQVTILTQHMKFVLPPSKKHMQERMQTSLSLIGKFIGWPSFLRNKFQTALLETLRHLDQTSTMARGFSSDDV